MINSTNKSNGRSVFNIIRIENANLVFINKHNDISICSSISKKNKPHPVHHTTEIKN